MYKRLARVLKEMDGECYRVGTLEIVPYRTGTPEEISAQKLPNRTIGHIRKSITPCLYFPESLTPHGMHAQ